MRIRLQEDGIDKYKVFLPGLNKDFPVGLVWKDIFKNNGWKIKIYFSLYSKREQKDLESKIHNDFMKAARSLAAAYNKYNFVNNVEEEDIFNFDYYQPDFDASD